MDPNGPGGRGAFSLRLPVSLSALEEGRLALLSYLQPFGFDPQLINRIEVVLEELVSNVVRHAAGADCLILEAESTAGGVWLAVEDNGPAFNPLDLPEQARFATLEDAVLGGQGIPLIKRLPTSVRYDRTGAHNRISAVFAAD